MDKNAVREFYAYLRQFWEKLTYWSNVHMLTHSALVMSPPQVYLLWYFCTNWDLHHEFPVRMTI